MEIQTLTAVAMLLPLSLTVACYQPLGGRDKSQGHVLKGNQSVS